MRQPKTIVAETTLHQWRASELRTMIDADAASTVDSTAPFTDLASPVSALDIHLWCYSKTKWIPCLDVNSGDKWRGELTKDSAVLLMASPDTEELKKKWQRPFRLAPGWSDEKGNLKPIDVEVPQWGIAPRVHEQ